MLPQKKMSDVEAEAYTDTVRDWWDAHPFTLGLGSEEENNLTGRVTQADRAFFDEVERKYRKWYIGATYDTPDQPLLAKFVPYESLRGKKVLDIAIGTGWSAVAFAQYGAETYGIDLTAEAIRMSARHAEIKNVTLHLQQMDAQRLQFPDAFFDFVLAWGCYMHMPDTERALAETCRVLKSSGQIAAYWYNKSSWTYWFNFLFLRGILSGKLLTYKFNTTRLVSRYTDGSSKGGNRLTKVYTQKELERMYRSAGFSQVKVETLPMRDEAEGWPMAKFPFFKNFPENLRSWLGRKMAWGVVVTATK
ncbi:MAG: class I SAM-dependent methyltransferase [Patescibacteria group bacterium]